MNCELGTAFAPVGTHLTLVGSLVRVHPASYIDMYVKIFIR